MFWWRLDFFVFIGSYAVLICLFLIGRGLAKKKNERFKIQGESTSAKLISVVIPYRNEQENLPKLLHSLSNLKVLPLEFIFVNDHSLDESESLILNWQSKGTKMNVNLKQTSGKKAAIQAGIENAAGEYILTWDADIEVSHLFFEELEQYSWGELNILPVEMNSSKLVAGFFGWDYQMQTQAALSVGGWHRPITASGANLLLQRKMFLEMQRVRTDDTLASGDDQFLLAACRNQKREIRMLVSPQLKVLTKPPKTIVEGIMQRTRWLKKSKQVRDNFATIFGVFVLLVQLSIYGFAFYQLLFDSFLLGMLVVLLKGELDALLCTFSYQKQFSTWQIYVYEWCYPVYILTLIFSIFFVQPIWKGRKAN